VVTVCDSGAGWAQQVQGSAQVEDFRVASEIPVAPEADGGGRAADAQSFQGDLRQPAGEHRVEC
jgi:hypothetical protein